MYVRSMYATNIKYTIVLTAVPPAITFCLLLVRFRARRSHERKINQERKSLWVTDQTLAAAGYLIALRFRPSAPGAGPQALTRPHLSYGMVLVFYEYFSLAEPCGYIRMQYLGLQNPCSYGYKYVHCVSSLRCRSTVTALHCRATSRRTLGGPSLWPTATATAARTGCLWIHTETSSSTTAE